MYIESLTLGLFYTNCFIVWNDDRDAFVIDPGSEPERIQNIIAAHDLAPRAVLLTHAHVDHIGAVPAIAANYGLPVILNPDDLPIYQSPENAFLPLVPPVPGLPATQPAFEEKIPGLEYTVLKLPGHTPGGVGYYFEGDRKLIAGDTLFQSSIGRTDLPGGDWTTLDRSIREVLYPLPADVEVFPGHGPPTTIGREMTENPFVRTT